MNMNSHRIPPDALDIDPDALDALLDRYDADLIDFDDCDEIEFAIITAYRDI